MNPTLIKTVSLFFLVLIFSCQPAKKEGKRQQEKVKDTVSLASLLNEMVDRESIARYPEHNFKLRQQSSYNRASKTVDDTEGWFNNIDRFEFIRIDTVNGKPEWVLMDHDGPGAMARVWMPDQRFSPDVMIGNSVPPKNLGTMRVYLDGNPKPIIEGSPYDIFNGTEMASYPYGHKSLSSAVSFLPFPWAKRCKITLDQEPFFYIFTYRDYEEGTKIKTFTKGDLASSAGLLQTTGSKLLNPRNTQPTEILAKTVGAGKEVTLKLPKGTNAIKTLSVKLDDYSNPQATRSVILKIKFDGQETIWTPIGDFFGTGIGLHPFKGWYRTVAEDGTMSCRWVMPYQESAEVSLLNLLDSPIEAKLEVATEDWGWDDRSMYFHANWKMETDINTRPFSDWNYITLKGRGVYVGDALTVWNPVERWWGEGDAKIWVDNETFPSMFGTGTEDYYAYSWGGKNRAFYEHPFHAQVRVDKFDKRFKGEVAMEGNTQGYSTETRTRAIDVMPFENSLQFDMEIWHWKSCKMDYAVGTYWYALPGAISNIEPMPDKAKFRVKNQNVQ